MLPLLDGVASLSETLQQIVSEGVYATKTAKWFTDLQSDVARVQFALSMATTGASRKAGKGTRKCASSNEGKTNRTAIDGPVGLNHIRT